MNACILVMSLAAYRSPALTGASCLPVSSSSDIARISSAASTRGAGAFPSSCSSRPAGVAMCAREGAGMHAGTSTEPGGCHGPGSKKHASRTPWISAWPSARPLRVRGAAAPAGSGGTEPQVRQKELALARTKEPVERGQIREV